MSDKKLINDDFKEKDVEIDAWPSGHFYSPIPDFSYVLNNLNNLRYNRKEIPGIDLNIDNQLSLLKDLIVYSDEYLWPKKKSIDFRYYQDNTFFGQGTGFFLYSLMRRFNPKKIIEVGSGFSSALMLDIRDKYISDLELLFIEPYPESRLLKLLTLENDQGHKSLIKDFVQNISLDVFETLGENDILFIDSSHVVKTGSDVVYLFTEIIPLLKSGVIIHIHDIYWPFEYPVSWLKKKWAWNEAHLLKALLQNNSKIEVLLFLDFLKKNHLESLSNFPFSIEFLGSSIYLRVK
jgi:predicted O-methyltransferase YrrM